MSESRRVHLAVYGEREVDREIRTVVHDYDFGDWLWSRRNRDQRMSGLTMRHPNLSIVTFEQALRTPEGQAAASAAPKFADDWDDIRAEYLVSVLHARLGSRFKPTDLRHVCANTALTPIDPPQSAGVYVVRARDRVKIGYTSNVRKRVRGMQTASPDRLDLIALMEGDFKTEKVIQRRFAPHRGLGEWFLLRADLLAFVIDQRSRFSSPASYLERK